jgi:hypothetical protein
VNDERERHPPHRLPGVGPADGGGFLKDGVHSLERGCEKHVRVGSVIDAEDEPDASERVDVETNVDPDVLENQVQDARPVAAQDRPRHAGDEGRDEQRHDGDDLDEPFPLDVGPGDNPGEEQPDHHGEDRPARAADEAVEGRLVEGGCSVHLEVVEEGQVAEHLFQPGGLDVREGS